MVRFSDHSFMAAMTIITILLPLDRRLIKFCAGLCFASRNPAAIASAYSAQQTVNQATMAGARRGQVVGVISHGAQTDINQHFPLVSVTVVDFYADWCALAHDH